MNIAPQTAASRIEPIPTLPIFFKLQGQRVLVAGGDPPAAWKTELLVAAGARVSVVAAEPCAELQALAASSGSMVDLERRPWAEADLHDAALAIGAFEDDGEAERFFGAARTAAVPVNVIDKPAFCDFQFGTLIVRSPMVIAITTDGAAPVLGQALRLRIEALLPANLRAWMDAAKAWRPAVRTRNWDFGRRRRFWEMVADRALDPTGNPPDDAAREALFDATDGEPRVQPTSIAFVGCGSGSPDDLTLAAARALQNADLVLHDADVPSVTAQISRREAVKRLVASDEQGVQAILDEPRVGRRIAWLGTGDPGACPQWAFRRAKLEDAFTRIVDVRGLDRCPRCSGRCRAVERDTGAGPDSRTKDA